MWVVDTCVVIDVYENDPKFGRRSARLLQHLLTDGLTLSPITMVELSAVFGGSWAQQVEFLDFAGIAFEEAWTASTTIEAHRAWNDYVAVRRAKRIAKRPVADLLIGAFAAQFQGLVTRNPKDFRRWFPDLPIQEP